MSETQAQRFYRLKVAALNHYFSRMNERQREAIATVHGPVLILAGAGSGKTSVLVNRTANLVLFGDGYEWQGLPAGLTEEDYAFLEAYADGRVDDAGHLAALAAHWPVRPWNILAITFTNKAADELKARLEGLLGDAARDIGASTFHSLCVRILRREIEQLGYRSSFTIYDADDSQRVIKSVMGELGIPEKQFAPRSVLSVISRAKDTLQTPQEMAQSAGDDFRLQTVARIYEGYQKRLFEASAVDFDDLIVLTVRLFQQFPAVLERYQNRFKYIMVDEYQDTNHAQYLLVSLLAAAHQNICVVGDDDQSIYRFRGATIENILSFEDQFEHAKVIRLEQNYRCTQTILDAANAVIRHNLERKGKTLWTENGQGDKIQLLRATDEGDEAAFIANTITADAAAGERFASHAILYRMNAQSNMIERALVRSGIPYRIIGGTRFYERKEIKDIMAYLSVIDNPADALRLRRIINEPKRGIGDATLGAAQEIADSLGVSLFDVIAQAPNYPAIARKGKALQEFTRMLEGLGRMLEEGAGLDALFDALLEQSGYILALQSQGVEGQGRIENIDELKSNILQYIQENEEPTLSGFLEEVALYTDLDSYNQGDDKVIMMTMHAAKGLEFDTVFLAGAEEGIFPGNQASFDPVQLEEERRLAYVAITRAKKRLYVTNAAQRMIFGSTTRNLPSRFLREIPTELCDASDHTLTVRRVSPSAPSRPASRPAFGGVSAAPRTAPSGLKLAAGDLVRHKAFGEGLVLSVRPMGNDSLVEIAFDTVGTKRIMANFAQMEKI